MQEQDLRRIECDPMCGFMVQSHDHGEVKKMAMNHVKNQHKKTITEKDVEKMWKRV